MAVAERGLEASPTVRTSLLPVGGAQRKSNGQRALSTHSDDDADVVETSFIGESSGHPAALATTSRCSNDHHGSGCTTSPLSDGNQSAHHFIGATCWTLLLLSQFQPFCPSVTLAYHA